MQVRTKLTVVSRSGEFTQHERKCTRREKEGEVDDRHDNAYIGVASLCAVKFQ